MRRTIAQNNVKEKRERGSLACRLTVKQKNGVLQLQFDSSTQIDMKGRRA
jgi:hypothetical protein